jgi:ABC-type nitrate/sulfonate/bicarbonate transport system permease component
MDVHPNLTGAERGARAPERRAEGAAAPTAGAPAPSAALRKLLRPLPSLAIAALLIVAWQAYADAGHVGDDVLPSPSRVVSQGWENRGDLWDNALPTLRATLLGFGCSLAIGFLLSVVIDASVVVRRALMPLLVVSQTLPLIAIAPLVVIWFGFGLLPKVLLVAFVTFFPITVAFVEGYAASDPDAATLLRSMGAGRWRVFRTLRLPTALPFFFAGLRIAITYAVVAAVFAEYAGAEEGLGIYMQNAKNAFRTDLVLAAVGVTAALTLVLFALTYLVERFALPYVRLQRRAGAEGGR